jgi:hypothetical protein
MSDGGGAGVRVGAGVGLGVAVRVRVRVGWQHRGGSTADVVVTAEWIHTE